MKSYNKVVIKLNYKLPSWANYFRLSAGSPLFAWGELKIEPEEVVRICRNWGINLIYFILSTGWPEKLEMEIYKWENLRKIFSECKRNGLHPCVYIKANSLFVSFFDENLGGHPEARNWLLKDRDGNPVHYGNKPARFMVCINHKGWLEKYVIPRGIAAVDIGADAIHLDNIEFAPTYCFCRLCKELFKKRLKERFTKSQLKETLGIEDLTRWDPSRDPRLKEPSWGDRLWQEWVKFHCESIAKFLNQFSNFITDYARRRYGRDIIIMWNTGPFLVGLHDETLLGVNLEMISRAIPEFEWGDKIDLGRIKYVNKAVKGPFMYYPFGHAEGLKKALNEFRTSELDPSDKDWLLLATGNIIWGKDIWFQEIYSEYYINSSPEANIAVLYSWPSIEWGESLASYLKVAEELSGFTSFDVLTLKDLDELEEYDLLILPRVECMDEKTSKRIEDYVRGGGNIISLGHVSLYDQHHVNRGEYLLRKVFGVSYEEVTSNPIKRDYRNLYGKGRSILLPYSGSIKSLVFELVSDRLPLLIEEFKGGFIQFKDEKQHAKIYKPQGQLRTLLYKDNDRKIIHLINPAVNVKVRVLIPEEWRSLSSFLISPYKCNEGKIYLEHKIECLNGHRYAVMTVPHGDLYSILILENSSSSVDLRVKPERVILEDGKNLYPFNLYVTNRSQKMDRIIFETRVNRMKKEDSKWKVKFIIDGKEVRELCLRPKETKMLNVLVNPPKNKDEVTQVTNLIIIGRSLVNSKSYDKVVLKLERPTYILRTLSRIGYVQNVGITGNGVRIYNDKFTLGFSQNKLPKVGRHGVEIKQLGVEHNLGAIVDLVIPHMTTNSGIENVEVIFSPPIGALIYSDKEYDQTKVNGISNLKLNILKNSFNHAILQVEFDQSPFHVIETIKAHHGDPKFYINYRFEAVKDGEVIDWYIPKMPLELRGLESICIAGAEGYPVVKPTPSTYTKLGQPIPENLWYAWCIPEAKKVLLLDFYSLKGYDFKDSEGVILEDGCICFPANCGKTLIVKKGDVYEFDFALSLLDLDETRESWDWSKYSGKPIFPDAYKEQAERYSMIYPKRGDVGVRLIDLNLPLKNLIFEVIGEAKDVTIRVRNIWRKPRIYVDQNGLPENSIKIKDNILEINLKEASNNRIAIKEATNRNYKNDLADPEN